MELVGFTETHADLQVRYQVLHMASSAFVWASSGTTHALPTLALAMGPGGRVPAATTVLHGAGAVASRGVAQKLAMRTGLVVYAAVSLPDDVGPLLERVTVRLAEELERGRR